MSNFDQLLLAITEQTAAFKVTFIELVRISSGVTFDNLPNKIIGAKSKIKSIEKEIRNCCKEKRDSMGRLSFADLDLYIAQTNPMRKEIDKLNRFIRQSEKFIEMGKEKYVEMNVDNADRMFDGKVFAMADKLNKKEFTPECKFSSLSSDPKLFDVVITDGEKKVHARSILAAEFSECMTAHFRFIITNAK
jgi:hypothetical protein